MSRRIMRPEGTPVDARRAQRTGAPRRGLRILQGIVTTVAGVAGVLVLLAALAPLAGLRLVELQTGSMSPDFPAGSVMLVRDASAQDAAVGDIVTVRRPDGAPVTHRVVSTHPAGTSTALVLRGDANADADPQPYLVTRVGLVVGGVPWGGQLLSLADAPAAVPILAAAVSLLVLWAWWPAPRRGAHRALRGTLRGHTA